MFLKKIIKNKMSCSDTSFQQNDILEYRSIFYLPIKGISFLKYTKCHIKKK